MTCVYVYLAHTQFLHIYAFHLKTNLNLFAISRTVLGPVGVILISLPSDPGRHPDRGVWQAEPWAWEPSARGWWSPPGQSVRRGRAEGQRGLWEC